MFLLARDGNLKGSASAVAGIPAGVIVGISGALTTWLLLQSRIGPPTPISLSFQSPAAGRQFSSSKRKKLRLVGRPMTTTRCASTTLAA